MHSRLMRDWMSVGTFEPEPHRVKSAEVSCKLMQASGINGADLAPVRPDDLSGHACTRQMGQRRIPPRALRLPAEMLRLLVHAFG